MTPKEIRSAVRKAKGEKIRVQALGLTLTVEKSSLIDAVDAFDANTETGIVLTDDLMLVGEFEGIPPGVIVTDEIEPPLPFGHDFEDMI